jgi:hypothetical protein
MLAWRRYFARRCCSSVTCCWVLVGCLSTALHYKVPKQRVQFKLCRRFGGVQASYTCVDRVVHHSGSCRLHSQDFDGRSRPVPSRARRHQTRPGLLMGGCG